MNSSQRGSEIKQSSLPGAAGPPTSVLVRPATTADSPVLGRLGALLVSLHHDFDPDRFISAGSNVERAYASFLEGQLARSNIVVLVAEKAGTVVGYAYAGVEGNDYMALRGPAGVLHDLVVDPAHRREGIGRVLLNTVIAALTERGAPRLVLSTAERNTAAQHLFASAGFRRTMIEMTRDLKPSATRDR